jgi:hypothetical protein
MVVGGDDLQKPRLKQEEHYRVQTEFQLLGGLGHWGVKPLALLAHPGRHLVEFS